MSFFPICGFHNSLILVVRFTLEYSFSKHSTIFSISISIHFQYSPNANCHAMILSILSIGDMQESLPNNEPHFFGGRWQLPQRRQGDPKNNKTLAL
jgi:hypothetical protein